MYSFPGMDNIQKFEHYVPMQERSVITDLNQLERRA